MLYEKSILQCWLALGLLSLWCGIVPVFSAETATASASASSTSPTSSDSSTPGLSNHPPSLSLRDTPSLDAPPMLASTASTTPVASTASTAPAIPSQNVTINLINLMVKRGLLAPDDAASLIKQAEQEADTARAQAATIQATAERALATQSTPPPAPAPAPSADDEVRVTYVPDVVKQQITDEVKADVMKQTREENSVAKSDSSDWTKRFRITGDIRARYEGQFYPSGNDNTGAFLNVNAINTGSGVDINPNNVATVPFNNVDQDRNRFRLRVRFGTDIDLGQNFSAGLRVATGSDNSPVTENQTFGGANSAQGGNFGKYAIWLDRAFIKYEMGGEPDKDLAFTIGRFDNPFFHTNMIWSDDVGFDGAVIQGKYKVAEGVTPFLVAGAFPVFNTDLNFSSNQSSKFRSEDKYLFAGQLGTNWTINHDFSAKVAVAYYHFENIEGKVSSLINASKNEAGDTDDSRPSFAQNGNTYMAIRDFKPLPLPTDTTPEFQYFGLATPFHEVAATGQLDFSRFDPFHMWLVGEFVKNVAFDRAAIESGGSPNMPGPRNNVSGSGAFLGGDSGYIVKLNLGKVALEELWDWNVGLSYRYVESDATVDAFTDSDFGGALAGTNLKGYTVGANLALSPRIWTGLRWMSADAIVGPAYKNDLIQFDINAKF